MKYIQWFKEHGKKHEKIIKKLKNFSDEQIIEYFKFDNMVKNQPDFCPLYKDNKKCHEYEELNCYLCACPYFRFDDEGIEKKSGKTVYSFCKINSKDGAEYICDNSIHQNCSQCLLPHKKRYIKNNFSRDWFFIMKDVTEVK